MGKIIIYRNGAAHLDLVERGKRTVSDATLSKSLLSDDSVKLKVASNSILDIKINDTFQVFGENYRINTLPGVKKVNNSHYQYDIEGQGLMYDLLRCKFFNADGAGFKTDTDFPLIGDLELFLTVVKNNMQRFSALWEIGAFPADTETKTLTFGDDTCLSALQKICQEFKTDFWVKSEAGKFKIHTGAFGSVIPIPVEYGKGKGLYSLSRASVNDEKIVNRLYVTGGSDNLPNEYRDFSKALKFSDDGYIEDAGIIAEMGLKEGSLNLPEIYPHRTGKVTALGTTAFKFVDNTMDFDLNERDETNNTVYLIPGTSAKVHFNTGNLAGYEFEIKKNGYSHDKKEFEIIPFTNDSGQKFPDPSSAAFQLAVNDEYVLLDIYAPAIYVTSAEAELLTKATEQFTLLKQAKVSYDLNIDPSYLSQLAKLPEIGDMLNVKDTALGIDKVLRINSISRNFIQGGEWVEFDHKITIADSYEINYASQLTLEVQDIRNIINIRNLGQINYSLIGLKTTEELKNLVFDTDGYFDAGNIKPFSIQTNMLSVGAQSQQLSLSVIFRVNADGLKNKVVSEAGKLFSQTLNKTWDISALTYTVPDDSFRYVYAKCSKTGTSGVVHYTQTQIKFDEDPNDYYFLLGILHSVTEGLRVLSITIGTTTINGGLVRTGTISSLDGLTYFNLNTGEIRGKITFTNDSPAFQQMNDAIVIGGRNLLKDSKKEINQNNDWLGDFELVEPLVIGQTYTITIDVAMQVPSHYFDINHVGGTLTSVFPVNGKGVKTFVATAAASKIIINRAPISSGSFYQFHKIKLEKGTKSTDWTPAIEDVAAQIDGANANSATALTQAQNAINTAAAAAAVTDFLTKTTIDGNTVATGTLLVGDAVGANAMISGVTDKPAGESIRFAAGKPYAEKYLSPFQVLDNGMVRFVNPTTGQKTFELGFNQTTGKVVFDIYNDNGVKIASIGSQGIVFTGYIAESYTETKFRKLTTSNFTASAIRTEIQNQIQKVATATGNPPTNPPWIQFDISIIENYTAYLYNEGRNFESAGNAQYAGYYPTANKFDSLIPNGIYVTDLVQVVTVGTRFGQNYGYTFTYYAEVYRIENGNVADTVMVDVTKSVDSQGQWINI